jgi:hypothetical protein
VSNGETSSREGSAGLFDRRPWGRGDLAALLVWTLAIVTFFWDVVSLRRALFYFDITEINYPYRAFFAEELRAGRFSRWCPGLYCGLPLFSESQAGYLHPLKYLLYPWLETWQAFNLDTVLSIWLTGVGTFFWLRRHVGPAGALTGAAIFGLGGFTWAHLIHTSMINALASVPLVIWGLEWSWSSGRWRGAALGGVALACQVFAGHLQDALLTVGLVGLYGLYRAATERGLRARARALGMAAGLVGVGVLIAAVQWVPSKELLDRSPRAGGLPWGQLIYGSWHPELLPTLVVREAYGTRGRDTDWLDGFYPYHEMDAYMGLVAMALAVVGAGGAAKRDRWSNFWVILVGVGAILMLGRFTVLFDRADQIPILGSSREPVRLYLWVSLGVAALAAVGVERLGRPGAVSLRGGVFLAYVLVGVSIPILCYLYLPVWTEPNRWKEPYHLLRYGWLGHELARATIRTGTLAVVGWGIARSAARSVHPTRRARWAALLSLLVIGDLLSAHWVDVPTLDPRYWTDAPESARRLKADPSLIRVFGVGDKHSGEPGYASERVDGCDLRLMSSVNDVSGIPTAGKRLIIVAVVNHVLHLRIFDGDGRMVVDTDANRLTESARPIEDLRKQLESLWPPHELTESEKVQVIAAVTSIVGYTLVDFLGVRDPLDWSLPSVWHVPASKGNTPMISRRLDLFSHATEKFPWRHDLESTSHIVTGKKARGRIIPGLGDPAGTAFIYRNAGALPRARLVGRPVYAEDQDQAVLALIRLGARLRHRVVVEDPTYPLPGDAAVSGTVRIVEDLPERVVVEAEAESPAYLVLADTFDPGWSAAVDGRPAPIRPAYVAFRAVYLPQGKHIVVFTYCPAGFRPGLVLTGCGIMLALVLWVWPRRAVTPIPDHVVLDWPSWWRTAWFVTLAGIVLISFPIPTFVVGPDGRPVERRVNRPMLQSRWKGSFHRFTWGSGLEAMHPNRM